MTLDVLPPPPAWPGWTQKGSERWRNRDREHPFSLSRLLCCLIHQVPSNSIDRRPPALPSLSVGEQAMAGADAVIPQIPKQAAQPSRGPKKRPRDPPFRVQLRTWASRPWTYHRTD